MWKSFWFQGFLKRKLQRMLKSIVQKIPSLMKNATEELSGCFGR